VNKQLRILTSALIITSIIIYLLPLVYCGLVLNSSQYFPEDEFLNTATNKKAIIVVAHDDDWYGCVGTVKNMCDKGWDVNAYCFYREPFTMEAASRISERKEGLLKCKEVIGLGQFNGIDLNFRFRPVEKPYMSIPYSEFENEFRYDSIVSIVTKIIDQNNPSVIFTLDDSIGLYGNAEHVLISQVILEICERSKIEKELAVERIYQSVLPSDMAEGIMVKYKKVYPLISFKRLFWHLTKMDSDAADTYTKAKGVYGCDGMPHPDVEISIRDFSKFKKDFIDCFPTERKNFKRFAPFFNWYPYWIYYRIFDKEYFRVIEIF